MFLSQLHLLHFKNYEEASFHFSAGVNCITGNNGVGKTNLLDAIHYLSFCKSYFNPIDSQNILHESPFFIVQGIFENEGIKDEIYCGVKRGQKKQFKKNQKEYTRLADHIGNFPLVMISPVDSNLISSGSEERRKFMDSIISQCDAAYLDDLIHYNRVLSHRNALLKQFSDTNSFDAEGLDLWDEQLVPLALKIHTKRRDFLTSFISVFRHFFHYIAGTDEPVDLLYETQLKQGDFANTLKAALSKDRALNYTTAGIHKDDLVFQLKGNSIKRYGSQGQQKSFLLGLKLAQFEVLKNFKKVKPLLLLDDIFDKLDLQRTNKLMELVSQDTFGQLFITDPHPQRLMAIFKEMNVGIEMFTIENGSALQHKEA
jgi:DNA replication and repair protein RecF